MKTLRIGVRSLAFGLAGILASFSLRAHADPVDPLHCIRSACLSSGNLVEATVLAIGNEGWSIRVRVDASYIIDAENFILPQVGEELEVRVYAAYVAVGDWVLLLSPPQASADKAMVYQPWGLFYRFEDGQKVGCDATRPNWSIPLTEFVDYLQSEDSCWDYPLPSIPPEPSQTSACQTSPFEWAWVGMGLGMVLARRIRLRRNQL